jgi:hypothetical protein
MTIKQYKPQLIDKLKILLTLWQHDYEHWKKDVWPEDLDSRYCCDGRECGCYGMTLRECYLTEPNE